MIGLSILKIEYGGQKSCEFGSEWGKIFGLSRGIMPEEINSIS